MPKNKTINQILKCTSYIKFEINNSLGVFLTKKDCDEIKNIISNKQSELEKSISEIKKLVSEFNCMGTYGMVELELNKIENLLKDV